MSVSVGQLIAHLSRFPEDMEIMQKDDNHFFLPMEINQFSQETITSYIKDGCEYTDNRGILSIVKGEKRC